MAQSVRRFTYGDQFDPKKFSLADILELCVANSPDRYKLQGEIRSRYFEGHGQNPSQRDENSTKMAMNCANQVNDVSRYYVILLEGDDIQRIVQDKTRIVDILNLKARRTFAKRELGMSDLGDEFIQEDEQPETIKELEEAISKAAAD